MPTQKASKRGVSIRFDSEVYERLREAAEAEARSVEQFCRLAVMSKLGRQEKTTVPASAEVIARDVQMDADLAASRAVRPFSPQPKPVGKRKGGA